MGMKRKERIQVLKTEVNVFLWVPLIMAGILVPLLTVIIWNVRQYTMSVCISYVKVLIVVTAVYLFVQIAGMKLIEFYVIRKVEGKN